MEGMQSDGLSMQNNELLSKEEQVGVKFLICALCYKCAGFVLCGVRATWK